MAKIYDTLSRQNTAIMVQLQLGHACLKSQLARIRSVDSGMCEYRDGKELV
jgi:hypothetical protein